MSVQAGRFSLRTMVALLAVLAVATAVGLTFVLPEGSLDDLRRAAGMQDAPPERHVIPAGREGWLWVRYGVAGAAPLESDGDVLVFRHPPSGVLDTATRWHPGLRRKEYVVDSPEGLVAIPTHGPGRRIWGEHELAVGESTGDRDMERRSVFFVGSKETYEREAARHLAGFPLSVPQATPP